MATEYGKGRDFISAAKYVRVGSLSLCTELPANRQDQSLSLCLQTADWLHCPPEYHRFCSAVPHSRLGRTDCVRQPPVTVHDLSHRSIIRIWPIDVAEDTSPPRDVHAFDISDKFFPPRAWLPSNVSLHLHDIYKPFPERFNGHFHVVHLRLFLTLSKPQVTQILHNATKLLSMSSRRTIESS